MTNKKIGILLTNTGTPDAPTPQCVRRYLREFLSDKRVVQLPRLIWLPILYGLVLPFRAKRSAKLYQTIWGKVDSPMRFIMHSLQAKLADQLHEDIKSRDYCIQLGMNYGNPSIEQALAEFKKQQVDRVIILPLYPQYSNTTTASTYDRVKEQLLDWPSLPDIIFIRDYHNHPDYIQALQSSLNQAWRESKANHLLISFHGIPTRFIAAGDVYQQHCEATAQRLVERLGLSPDQWTLCYQSKFGYDKWLQPSTQQLLVDLPKKGITEIDVICPGFSVDCLETLEEIQITGSETFHAAGGKLLRYIPALNDNIGQITLLTSLIKQYC